MQVADMHKLRSYPSLCAVGQQLYVIKHAAVKSRAAIRVICRRKMLVELSDSTVLSLAATRPIWIMQNGGECLFPPHSARIALKPDYDFIPIQSILTLQSSHGTVFLQVSLF